MKGQEEIGVESKQMLPEHELPSFCFKTCRLFITSLSP